MICNALAAVPLPDGSLYCTADPRAALLGGALALLAGALSLAWAVLRSQGGLPRMGGILAALALVLLGAGAGLPEWQRAGPKAAGGRVAVVIDTSESVRRNGSDAYAAELERLSQSLDDFAQSLPPDRDDWRGVVIGAGSSPTALSGEVSIENLADTVTSAQPGPAAEGSDIGGALRAALTAVGDGPGGGAVFLLSDGWATEDISAALMQRIAGSGVPIHVLPYGAERPIAGLLAANLGPERTIGEAGVARLSVLGGGTLHWQIGDTLAPPISVGPSDKARAVRLPVTFAERGLHFVDLSFETEDGTRQFETLYTLVRGPARVLAYGPAPWLDDLSPDRFQIVRADPGSPRPPSGFDAVVIDTLSPQDFGAGAVQEMLRAGLGGTGLMLVNGPLRGTREDPQRIADWEDSALGPVLPVNSDAQEYVAEPPGRDILVVLDTSGSMGGGNMDRARAATIRIIESLRAVDRLRIIPFATGVGRLFESPGMTPAEASRATGYVNSLGVGGATEIGIAVRAARQLSGSDCHLFVIGDGGYDARQIIHRPICTLTTIGVQNAYLPGFDTRWGEQIRLASVQQLGDIEYEVLEPKLHTYFWRDGPLRLTPADPAKGYPDGVTTSGLALSYLRPESTVEMIAADPPRNLALVMRHDTQNRTLSTGVFLGDLRASDPRTAPSVDLALEALIGWNDPDRFDIRIIRENGLFRFQVTSLGNTAPPSALSATITVPGGNSVGVDLAPGQVPGLFEGTAALRLSDNVEKSLFILDSGGDDVQLIPMTLPSIRESAATISENRAERASLGINWAFLDALQQKTGGQNLLEARPQFSDLAEGPPPVLIWPALLAVGALLYALSLFFGRVQR